MSQNLKNQVAMLFNNAKMGNPMSANQLRQIVSTYLAGEYRGTTNNSTLNSFGCSFKYKDNYNWTVSMVGPQNTPYAGGIFHIDILFPQDYPCHGPEFVFQEKIYHCNVNWSNTACGEKFGHVCLSTLNEWRTTGIVRGPNKQPIKYGVVDALIDIFSLFHSQGTASPFSDEMAQEYLNNREQFEQKAREWTAKYATGRSNK